MEFSKIYNNDINETVYFAEHASGVGVFIISKKNFSKKYAIIGANIGSVNNTFIPLGENEPTKVPDGVAHFLEHKMFEQSDGTNAFDKFAQYGANANAFTSFTNTCYLFSCTDNFNECFSHLLSYVADPYFTEENVSKEMGIIGQEIRMYDDDGSWRVMFNLLEAMYEKCPVNVDIAGTVESISHITKDTLYKCYNTFYNPSNMVICVCGDVDIEKTGEIIDKVMPDKKTGTKAKSIFPEEGESVFKKSITQNLSVAMPLFNIGYKDKCGYGGDELLKNEIAAEILLMSVAGKSSDLYSSLYEEGLINEEFSYDLMYENAFSCVMIGGESKNPELVCEKISDYIAKKGKISEDEFLRAKKVIWGDYVRTFNNVEKTAQMFLRNTLKGINTLNFKEIFDETDIDFVNQKYKELFAENKKAVSTVYPSEGKKDE